MNKLFSANGHYEQNGQQYLFSGEATFDPTSGYFHGLTQDHTPSSKQWVIEGRKWPNGWLIFFRIDFEFHASDPKMRIILHYPKELDTYYEHWFWGYHLFGNRNPDLHGVYRGNWADVVSIDDASGGKAQMTFDFLHDTKNPVKFIPFKSASEPRKESYSLGTEKKVKELLEKGLAHQQLLLKSGRKPDPFIPPGIKDKKAFAKANGLIG